MNGIGEQRGSGSVEAAAWSARVLAAAPMIVPARMYMFPQKIAGEEDALARGAMWVEVRAAGKACVAQCAQGYATGGVAQGLWHVGDDLLLAVAGGYGYAIRPSEPEGTALLPLRPVVQVLSVPAAQTAVLAGFHTVLVVRGDSYWESPRLSWEGVMLAACDGDVLRGSGWDVATDEDVPFELDLRTRELRGGGYRS